MKSGLRLRRSSDFEAIRQSGQVCKHFVLVLNYAENNLLHNRYGIVVSKRVGSAVVRNLIKRRLREALYQIHPRLKQGYDVIVIARPVIVEQPFEKLLRILVRLFNKAKLIEDNKLC